MLSVILFPNLAIMNMKNAFNECNRSAFLDGVSKEFPEILPGCIGATVNLLS